MIEMNKTYRYRNGEPARVLCVDGPETHRPVLSVSLKDGTGWKHAPDGSYAGSFAAQGRDLVEILPDVVEWQNQYPLHVHNRAQILWHATRASVDAYADNFTDAARIGLIKRTLRVGKLVAVELVPLDGAT